MSEEIEAKLLRKIEELEREIKSIKGDSETLIPTFSFSSIKFSDLESLVDIKQIFLHREIFDSWFDADIDISKSDIEFLKQLRDDNIDLINLYHEEDLKINFIAPL
jgi:hypothetical protein